MNSLIKNIINHKNPVYFISPHLDDAVFSAGSLISHLSKKTSVTVINVFTRPSRSAPTLSAKAFLSQCGYNNDRKLFLDRIKEDENVLAKLRVKVINLGFIDALWRKHRSTWLGRFIPEIDHTYPTYRWHINTGMVSKRDHHLINLLGTKLKKIVSNPDAVVFCPVDIAKHIDHQIVRDICNSNFTSLIYWTDYPYSLSNSTPYTFIQNHFLKVFSFPSMKTKADLISGYQSQMAAIFKNKKINLIPETYYFKPDSRPKVSIGIPALNEEANIGRILEDLLAQDQQEIDIKTILVYSDGSTDSTNKIVASFSHSHPVIKLIASKIRHGLAYGQNIIYKNAKSDYLVVIQADTRVKDPQFIKKLIAPLLSNLSDMAAAMIVPVKPLNKLDGALKLSMALKETLFTSFNRGNNIYTCHGPARAYSKKMYKSFQFDYDIGEDAFSYLKCISSGYRYTYVPQARIYFRLPTSLAEHVKQSLRFHHMRKTLSQNFSSDLINKEMTIPLRIMASSALKGFRLILNQPLEFVLYLCFSFLTFIISFFVPSQTHKWDMITSSKRLE